MGLEEGEKVGVLEGARVGLREGEEDGEKVGAVEGESVGALEGKAEGELEGAFVGVSVGGVVLPRHIRSITAFEFAVSFKSSQHKSNARNCKRKRVQKNKREK